jgi:acyl-CoA reductase-like NAD-dependent aldehyde dehydrogenase
MRRICSVKTHPLRIGGELRESPDRETVDSPYDGAPVGEVHVGTAPDMDDAIAAAAAAFDVMRRLPTHRRAAILEGTAASRSSRN